MQRRHFIGIIAGLIPSLSVANARPQSTLIQQSPIAGFQYHQGEELWDQLAIGQPLTLHREPDNRYDKRAVRVEWQGHKLGYVPRAENAAVAQMLGREQALQARIDALERSQNPWQRIRFSVSLRSGPAYPT